MNGVLLGLGFVGLFVIAYGVAVLLQLGRGIHRELVRIRLAAESLHDRAVPELLVKDWERRSR